MRNSLALLLLPWNHEMIDKLLRHLVIIIAILLLFFSLLYAESFDPVVLHQVNGDVEGLRGDLLRLQVSDGALKRRKLAGLRPVLDNSDRLLDLFIFSSTELVKTFTLH